MRMEESSIIDALLVDNRSGKWFRIFNEPYDGFKNDNVVLMHLVFISICLYTLAVGHLIGVW